MFGSCAAHSSQCTALIMTLSLLFSSLFFSSHVRQTLKAAITYEHRQPLLTALIWLRCDDTLLLCQSSRLNSHTAVAVMQQLASDLSPDRASLGALQSSEDVCAGHDAHQLRLVVDHRNAVHLCKEV